MNRNASDDTLDLAERFDESLRTGSSRVVEALPSHVAQGLRRLHDAFRPGSQPTQAEDAFTLQSPRPELDRIGRFQLFNVLGSGSFGVVFRGFDEILKRDVAVKVSRLHTTLSRDLITRFLRESEAAARLHHPNVVQVFEAGTEGAVAYIVSELCEGESLKSWLAHRRGPAPPLLAAEIVECLADAVHHAHLAGIVHRDLKPANVLVIGEQELTQPRQQIKLCDFGLARFLDWAGSTMDGTLLGTVSYMSREQVKGDRSEVGPASDIYALGVILFELLTRELPFGASQDANTLQRICESDAPSPRRFCPEIPPDLAAICLKCLEKSPAQRYSTAEELKRDLARFRDGRPTVAHPLTPLQISGRWLRRHRGPGALIGLAVLGICSALVSSLMAARAAERHAARSAELTGRMQDERDRATAARLEARQQAYVADLRLAFQQYEQGLILEASELLAAHAPEPGADDIRGVEWKLLHALVEPQFDTIGQHDGRVHDLDVFADGRRIVTAGEDGAINIWDREDPARSRRLWSQDSPLFTAGVSPDGRWIGFGTGKRDDEDPKHVAVVDVESGRTVGHANSHTHSIRSIRFSPDGTTLASGSTHQHVALQSLSFNAPSRLLVPDGEENGPRNDCIQFLNHGSQLVAIDLHRAGFRVWDVATGTGVHDVREPENHTIGVFVWNEARSFVAYTNWFGEWVRLLDVKSGKLLREIDLGETVSSLEASTSGDVLYAGTINGKIHVVRLNWKTDDKQQRTVEAVDESARQVHVGKVNRIRSLEGDGTLSAGADGRIVHYRPMQAGPTKSQPAEVNPTCQSTHPSGRWLAWGGVDHVVRIADAKTRRIIARSEPLPSQIKTVSWSGAGRHVAVLCEQGQAACWAWAAPKLKLVTIVQDRDQPAVQGLASVLVDDRGARLYVGGRDPDGVQVWTLPEGKLQRRWTTDFGVGAMLATADGKRIIAGHQGGVDVFDAASGRRLKKLKGGATVSRMLLHPDQRRLVSADEDGIVRVWNIETGSMEQTLTAYDRNDAEIAALAWSNDLRSLIAGDNQGVLRFWNVGSWDYTGGITVCSKGNCIREVQMARDGQSLELVVGSGLAERHFASLPLQVSVEE